MAKTQQLAAGNRVIFVWPITSIDFEDPELFGEDPSPVGLRLVDYQSAMKMAAANTNSTFVDGPTIVKQAGLNGENALLDEVHPSAQGHQALAQGIAAALKASGQ